MLASAGYPTLDIGYSHLLGLPATLLDIPLEYFATGIRWLDTQAEVNPQRVYVLGASRVPKPPSCSRLITRS